MLTVNTVPIGGLNVSTRADIIPYLEKIDLSQILSHTPNFSINIFFRHSGLSVRLCEEEHGVLIHGVLLTCVRLSSPCLFSPVLR